MDSIQGNHRRLRVLVAIASHGEKNLGFLKKIIETYRALSADVEVVVLSNIPKDLGPGVKVVVGLPAKNPWTLPFAHKEVFAQSLEKFDLFVFSEDDIGVTERNIQAFLRATPQIAADEIAGYLRYEVDPSGRWSLPEVHGAAHWKPETVKRRGEYIIAQFTNEHAGFYILTQAQLRKAISSGGFLTAPHEGRYGLPETAATDPYTRCGFRKVICISALEDFLVHHMPNRYAGRLGVALDRFREQIQTLASIQEGAHPASTLCEAESRFLHGRWSKDLYEEPDEDILKFLPAAAKSILSVGSGAGATEVLLAKRGAAVTAIPIDSVLGAGFARSGIEVIYGTLDECLTSLNGRRFGAVLVSHLLHLLPDPDSTVERCARLVDANGALLISGPNFGSWRLLAGRLVGRGDYRKLRAYEQGGITVCSPRTLSSSIRRAGLRVAEVEWLDYASSNGVRGGVRQRAGSLTAKEWILQARR